MVALQVPGSWFAVLRAVEVDLLYHRPRVKKR